MELSDLSSARQKRDGGVPEGLRSGAERRAETLNATVRKTHRCSMYTSIFRRGGKNAEFSNQNLLHRGTRLHGLADADDGLHDTGT